MLKRIKKIFKKTKKPVIIRQAGFASKVDPDALKVISRLKQFNHSAYVVGGAVRDFLLDQVPKDFDVVTSATPNQIKKIFRNCFIIGRRFRLAHIRFKDGKIIETSTFRQYHGQDAAGTVKSDNIFGSEEEDAFRRDFTLNALLYDPEKDVIVDYTGGVKDIKNKLIRCIGPAEERLKEDPVRILRAIKFSISFGLKIEEELNKAIQINLHLIKECSSHRLYEELMKILRSSNCVNFFIKANENGFLKYFMPLFNSTLNGPNRSEFLSLLKELQKYNAKRDKPVSDAFILSLLAWRNIQFNSDKTIVLQKLISEFYSEVMDSLPISKLNRSEARNYASLFYYFYLDPGNKKLKRLPYTRIFSSPILKEALEAFRIIELAEKGSDENYKYWKKRMLEGRKEKKVSENIQKQGERIKIKRREL